MTCPNCGEDPCGEHDRCRYPYRHNGPSVHGSKLLDYLISENSLREDNPELFKHEVQIR